MSEQIKIVDNFYDSLGSCHDSFYNKKPFNHEEVIFKLQKIIGNKIKLLELKFDTENCEEIKASNNTDWTAVIYLTYAVESFGETGIKFFSYDQEERFIKPVPKEIDDTKLKMYGNIPAKCNRLVLFRSNLWHSMTTNLNNSILYQKLIFNND